MSQHGKFSKDLSNQGSDAGQGGLAGDALGTVGPQPGVPGFSDFAKGLDAAEGQGGFSGSDPGQSPEPGNDPGNVSLHGEGGTPSVLLDGPVPPGDGNVPFADGAGAETIGDDPDLVPIAPTLRDGEVPNVVGEILKHAREMMGLSQREVARRLRVRVNTVSDIEQERLNQRTAEPFAARHIANYARIAGIDPRVLVDLYHKQVRQAGKAARKRVRPRKAAGNSHFWRNLALGLGALVVVVLVAKFPVARDDHGSSGALIVSGAGQAEPAPTEAGREPVAAVAPVATVQERNLEKAREQERELRAERQGGEELAAPREQEGHSGALELSGAAAAAVPASTPAAAQEPRGTSLSDLLTAPEIKSHTASESQEAGEAAAQESASQGSARDAGQRAETPAAVAASPAPEAKPAQEEVPAIKSPTDVSRQVRIVNRQGLAALNSVEIRFKGAVALRITDHKGKILKDGTFKKGDHLKVSGIPPFTVSTSDGTLIGISYQGGEVVVPKRKQIRFALPTK